MPTNKTQLGAYVGNEPDHLARFEAWIGQETAPLGYLAGDTWEDIASPGWVLDMWKDAGTVFWSVPLIPNDGTTLAQAATGQFNDYYRRAAQALADQHPMDDDGKVFIRTGWEMGGGWFPWGADGDNEAFKEAFRQLVDTFRSVDDDFVFCFDFVGNYQDPRNFYPGKEWVDIISQDFYWNPQWTSYDSGEAFDIIRDMPWGLAFTEQWAASEGLPTAYAEWGAKAGLDGSEFIRKSHEWFESHNAVQATYWDHWSAFDGELSDDQGSVNAQTFNEVFGVPTAGSGAVPWTPEGTAPSGGAPTAPQGPGTGVVGERPEQSEGGIAPPPVTGGGSPTPSPAPSDPGSSAPPPAATSTTLDGGTSDAPLIGGAGNELIRSGEGAPYMAGGAGADSFVIEAGAGQLTLADFSHAEGDRILLDGIAASAVTIEAHSHDGSDGQILLFEGGHAWLPGVHDLTTADLGAVTDNVLA